MSHHRPFSPPAVIFCLLLFNNLGLHRGTGTDSRRLHQLKIPTNSPVGIFLLIAACSRASARVHADFGFSCRSVFQPHSALSWPLFSAPSRRHWRRSPQAQNSYFYLFNELRAALLTRFLRSIGSRWKRSALMRRMAAMLRSAVNPYRRPRGTRPVAVG